MKSKFIAAVATAVVSFATAVFMAMIGVANDAFEFIVIYHIFTTFMIHIFRTITVERSDDE